MRKEDGMVRFRKGDWYKVTFLDHCLGTDRPMECVVYGYITKLERKYIVLSWWEVNDDEYRECNQELVVIIRSTIVSAEKVGK